MQNTPVETISYVALIFGLTEIFKYALKIKGDAIKVQLLGLFIAECFAFADAFYGSATVPVVTGNLIFLTALRGINLGAAAFGWNGIKSAGQKAMQGIAIEDPDTASPLAPVKQAVDKAQELTSRATSELGKVEQGVNVAATLLKGGGAGAVGAVLLSGMTAPDADSPDEYTNSADAPADAPVLPSDVPAGISEGSGPFKPEDTSLIVTVLTRYMGATVEQAAALIQNNPDEVRNMLRQIARNRSATNASGEEANQ